MTNKNTLSKYADAMFRDIDMEKINEDSVYQEAMREKYAEVFASEQGGNVSNDIEF